MSSQYETLGWNEQNVLALPSLRTYLCKSILRFFTKLLIIVSIHTYNLHGHQKATDYSEIASDINQRLSRLYWYGPKSPS